MRLGQPPQGRPDVHSRDSLMSTMVWSHTTRLGAMRGRHVSIVIHRPAEVVYDFAADPATLPRWAAGLATGEVRIDDDELVVDSPMGRVRVRFVPRNVLGVLDHEVTLPDGTRIGNPLRVLPHPHGAEVVFTIRDLVDDPTEFTRDAEMVAADLDRLRHLLEGHASPDEA